MPTMNDRESIVSDLRKIATEPQWRKEYTDVCKWLADRYESNADIGMTFSSAKPTREDLLALHDLDLGMLAYKAGITGGIVSQKAEDAILSALSEHNRERSERLRKVSPWQDALRTTSASGAKIRAALIAAQNATKAD